MLYYSEIAISPLEVPEELSICIYVSGCQNNCDECHYPELQQPEYGDPLIENLSDIVDIYARQATCVCFMGEGKIEDRDQLIIANEYAQRRGFKTCLYSGRDEGIYEWMKEFHYLKLGMYRKDRGPLSSQTTNQRFYRRTLSGYEDNTHLFWDL